MTDADVFAQQTGVSRETLARLQVYAGLLSKWNPRINLVAPATLPNLWQRHFLDSAQVHEAAPQRIGHWADLGTGGGFPGLVVAILAADTPTKVTLVESDQRKAAFLRTVVQAVGVDATVIAKRIEEVAPLAADVVSARALAPLPKLLDLCTRHLAPGGVALLPKGARADAEIAKALETWQFRCEKTPSRTEDGAVILKLSEIQRE
ncbi:MAG: 16S rRNA (guanine(527)-N(7))-methyltransferase RsmG [Pseudomonadota bacterium]